ncbi:MAG: hypothetical protein AB7L13_15945 [Acidimicrobiia bacterium]
MERLGDRLLAAGRITSEQLARGLSVHQETGDRLGEVLVDLGIVTIPDILSVVVEQRAAGINTGRLGDILVERGCVSRVQIGKAVALQKRDVPEGRRLLGEVLLDEGMITRRQLFDALEQQLEVRASSRN